MMLSNMCPVCCGSGWVSENTYIGKQPRDQHMVKCKKCNGTGKVNK